MVLYVLLADGTEGAQANMQKDVHDLHALFRRQVKDFPACRLVHPETEHLVAPALAEPVSREGFDVLHA